METIERSIKSNLTAVDLQVLQEINSGLDYYKSLAFRLSWFNSGFDLKEFITLHYDFRDFYNETAQEEHEIYLYHLNSYIKSFKSLLNNYDTHFKNADLMFRDFIIDSIVSLALMCSELLSSYLSSE